MQSLLSAGMAAGAGSALSLLFSRPDIHLTRCQRRAVRHHYERHTPAPGRMGETGACTGRALDSEWAIVRTAFLTN